MYLLIFVKNWRRIQDTIHKPLLELQPYGSQIHISFPTAPGYITVPARDFQGFKTKERIDLIWVQLAWSYCLFTV